MNKMKVALIKQDVYQDLYVGNKEMNISELLFSSSGRVGPIGLFEEFDCDFYIVKEEKSTECHMWKKTMPQMVKEFKKLKTELVTSVKGMEFHVPGSNKPNGFYAVSCDSINWGMYQIVISINISIPTRIVMKFPKVLWTYMIGEANFAIDKAYFGYDLCLNQMIRGEQNLINKVIDFPYTFVGPYTLEKIAKNEFGIVEKKGIYGEINTTTERPVKRIPQFEPISEITGEPILFHKQNIKENLFELYRAKYYLKVGGRITRGNGIIEAISLGTVALLSPDDVICTQILPKEAWVFDSSDAINKINFLNNNPDEYKKLLFLERQLCYQFVINYPKHWLLKAFSLKQSDGVNKNHRYCFFKYIIDIMKRAINKKERISIFNK